MVRDQIDRRAVCIGAVGGAVTIALPLLLAGERLTDPYVMFGAVTGIGIVAGAVSGAITGYASQIGMKPMHEGAIAATIGFCLGLSAWIVGQAYWSPLHPADTSLRLLYTLTLPVIIAFPFTVIIGAFAGEHALFSKSVSSQAR